MLANMLQVNEYCYGATVLRRRVTLLDVIGFYSFRKILSSGPSQCLLYIHRKSQNPISLGRCQANHYVSKTFFFFGLSSRRSLLLKFIVRIKLKFRFHTCSGLTCDERLVNHYVALHTIHNIMSAPDAQYLRLVIDNQLLPILNSLLRRTENNRIKKKICQIVRLITTVDNNIVMQFVL
ncbi:hypothetical protein YC2023_093222 [Brassica napus]